MGARHIVTNEVADESVVRPKLNGSAKEIFSEERYLLKLKGSS